MAAAGQTFGLVRSATGTTLLLMIWWILILYVLSSADWFGIRWGGVCILINKKFKAVQVNMLDTPDSLEMCVDLILPQRFRIFLIYRPCVRHSITGDDELSDLTHMNDCLDKYCNSFGPNVIVGDFNCPNINWSTMQRPELISRKFFWLCGW